MRLPILALLLALLALPAGAQQTGAPQPPLPRDRPAAEAATSPTAEEAEPNPDEPAAAAREARDVETPTAPAADDASPVPLPRERPDESGTAPAAPDEPAAEPESPPPAAADADVAEPEPPRVYRAACPAVLTGEVEARLLDPIEDDTCGERSPLAVTGVRANGRMVPLSTEATLTCPMASQLPGWASAIDGYLEARENTRLARIVVGTSYACRPRNNVSGADVSEHGFANALDVVGFELEDGRTMSLPGGWTDPLAPAGRLLRFAHDAACASFTTTLGPEANALHEDHLHIDLGCHGQSCTARLCE